MLSGSKNNQTIAATIEAGQNIGAMSYAFIQVMNKQSNQSYLALLNNLRFEMINNNYSQKPQLSTSHPTDVNLQFTL